MENIKAFTKKKEKKTRNKVKWVISVCVCVNERIFGGVVGETYEVIRNSAKKSNKQQQQR